MNDNYGIQYGDRSINVGTGNFTGANVHVGDNVHTSRTDFTAEEVGLARRFVIEKRVVNIESLSRFSIISACTKPPVLR